MRCQLLHASYISSVNLIYLDCHATRTCKRLYYFSCAYLDYILSFIFQPLGKTCLESISSIISPIKSFLTFQGRESILTLYRFDFILIHMILLSSYLLIGLFLQGERALWEPTHTMFILITIAIRQCLEHS